MKKLYRLRKDKILGGVCGGLGHYFNIDPVIVRALWVAAFLLGGVGFLAYIIAWIIIPEEPVDIVETQSSAIAQTAHPLSTEILIGAFLIIFGIMALGGSLGWFTWHTFWKIAIPAIVVMAGLFVLIYAIKYKKP